MATPRLPGEAPTASPPGVGRSIGVFDSGVGGLTVVKALRKVLPGEAIEYLGDTARLPYGTKSPQTVERYSQHVLDFLHGRGVKAVVVACNTASALALPRLRSPAPIWGVIEPGARRAAEVSDGRVGVLATEATVASDAYGAALRRLRPEIEVVSQSCPLFVPLVEEGWIEHEVTETVARSYLEPLLQAEVDTVVLGCTHYPLLQPVLARLAGDAVRWVDSAEATARVVAGGLAEAGLLANAVEAPVPHLCVTDAADRFARIARQILGAGGGTLELVEL